MGKQPTAEDILTTETVPPGVRFWNWGAFFLGPVWAIAHGVKIQLFTPFWFYKLPATGSEMAWKNGKWNSVEDFRKTQRKWAFAGLLVYVVVIAAIVWSNNYNLSRT